jgi:hypothetical protein
MPAPERSRPEDLREVQAELEAALAARVETGVELEPQLVEGFVERIGRRIDERVDTRLAESPRSRGPDWSAVALALGSFFIGIPVTGAALSETGETGGLVALAIAWIAILLVNVAYNRRRT